MKHEVVFHWRKQLVWGILFIVWGSVMLLDRAGIMEFDLDIRQIWHYWPWLLVVIGISQLIPPTTPSYFLSGLWNLFFAGWWYVSFESVWGLGFGDTWPALLVAWGTGMVLRPFVNKYFASNEE